MRSCGQLATLWGLTAVGEGGQLATLWGLTAVGEGAWTDLTPELAHDYVDDLDEARPPPPPPPPGDPPRWPDQPPTPPPPPRRRCHVPCGCHIPQRRITSPAGALFPRPFTGRGRGRRAAEAAGAAFLPRRGPRSGL